MIMASRRFVLYALQGRVNRLPRPAWSRETDHRQILRETASIPSMLPRRVRGQTILDCPAVAQSAARNRYYVHGMRRSGAKGRQRGRWWDGAVVDCCFVHALGYDRCGRLAALRNRTRTARSDPAATARRQPPPAKACECSTLGMTRSGWSALDDVLALPAKPSARHRLRGMAHAHALLRAPGTFLEKQRGDSRKQRLISRDHLNSRSSEAPGAAGLALGSRGP